MAISLVASWTPEQRLIETLQRSKKHFAPAVQAQIDQLLTPTNVAIMLGTLVVWGVSHVFGVGEVVDVLLLIFGAAMLGPSIVQVVEHLLEFAKCLDARTDREIDVCAKHFADAVILGGITTILAILLRRGAKTAQARAGVGQSWLKVMKPKSPGLIGKGLKDPHAGEWWSKLTTRKVKSFPDPSTKGSTGAFGDIKYLASLVGDEREMVLLHETVHRFFSPRLALFRTFRARMVLSGYGRSFLLKALEEMLAQVYAQLRVHGLKAGIKAIAFPFLEGYVTVEQAVGEGIAIGSVMFGAERFHVMVVQGAPDAPGEDWEPTGSPLVVAPTTEIVGGFAVELGKGLGLSDVAQQYYGDPHLWPLIYDLNKDKIGENPNVVRSGTRLLLLPLRHYSKEELDGFRKRSPDWRKHPTKAKAASKAKGAG